MAEDVNAVIAGLFEAGRRGNRRQRLSRQHAQHLPPSELEPEGVADQRIAEAAVDDARDRRDYDAAIFVGYHARAGTAPAILDHTISSGTIRAIRINGQELPEMGINAAIAGTTRCRSSC